MRSNVIKPKQQQQQQRNNNKLKEKVEAEIKKPH